MPQPLKPPELRQRRNRQRIRASPYGPSSETPWSFPTAVTRV
jgi:hypothetical protein